MSVLIGTIKESFYKLDCKEVYVVPTSLETSCWDFTDIEM